MAERLFIHVIPYLKSKGRFFATYHRREAGIWIGKDHINRADEYATVRYPFSFFEDLAHKNKMVVEYLDSLSSDNDVHHQDWMCFKRK
jgi:hypothetical protein